MSADWQSVDVLFQLTDEELQQAGVQADAKKPIETLIERIIAAKRTNPHADVSALEAKIDAHVYRLYGLTAEEIAVVEATA